MAEKCGSLFPGGHGETRTCQLARNHGGEHVYRKRPDLSQPDGAELVKCSDVEYGPTIVRWPGEILPVGTRLWHFKGGEGHVIVKHSTCREHHCGGGCDYFPDGDLHPVEVCECGDWPDYADARHWEVLL